MECNDLQLCNKPACCHSNQLLHHVKSATRTLVAMVTRTVILVQFYKTDTVGWGFNNSSFLVYESHKFLRKPQVHKNLRRCCFYAALATKKGGWGLASGMWPPMD